jgi:hypothetical protein
VLEHLEGANEIDRRRGRVPLVVCIDDVLGADPSGGDRERDGVGLEADIGVATREQSADRSLSGADLEDALDVVGEESLYGVEAEPGVQREWRKAAAHGCARA